MDAVTDTPRGLDLSGVVVDDVKADVAEEIALVPRVNQQTIARLDTAIASLEQQASTFTCETPADYALGDAAVGRIRQLEKLYSDVIFGPQKAYWNEKLKVVRAEEAKRLPILERVKKAIGAKMITWSEAEKAKAREAARVAEETARREAEELRLAQAEQVDQRAKETGNAELREAAVQMLAEPLDIAPTVAAKPAVSFGGNTKMQERDHVEVQDLGQALIAIGATLLSTDKRCPDALRDALEPFYCKSTDGLLDGERTVKNLAAALETWARNEYKSRGARFVVPGIFAGKKPVLG